MPTGQKCMFIISVYWKICEFSEQRAGLNSRGCQRQGCCFIKVCKPSLSKQLCMLQASSISCWLYQYSERRASCAETIQMFLDPAAFSHLSIWRLKSQQQESAIKWHSVLNKSHQLWQQTSESTVCTENYFNNQLFESISRGILNISSFSNVRVCSFSFFSRVNTLCTGLLIGRRKKKHAVCANNHIFLKSGHLQPSLRKPGVLKQRSSPRTSPAVFLAIKTRILCQNVFFS